MWHLQITPTWKFTWTYNDYHKGLKHGCFKMYEQKLCVPLSHFDKDVDSKNCGITIIYNHLNIIN